MSKDETAKEAHLALVLTLIAAVKTAVESGKLSTWQKSWLGSFDGIASNVLTGNRYRGGNVLVLAIASYLRGFESTVWATANQWHKAGCRITDDEFTKYTVAIFWKQLTRTVENADTGEDETQTIPFMRHFRLYNLEQTEVVTQEVFDRKAKLPEPPKELPAGEIPGHEFFEAIPATVRPGEPKFIPALDIIEMPGSANFETPENYSATFAHELTHWTGHKDRLDRVQKGRGDLGAYAFEELIAELGAAMVCGHFGIQPVTRDDHVQYLRAWITHLEDDPQALWTAATKASAAFEHLVEYSEAVAEQAA